VLVSGEQLGKHHQNVPYGTPAWSKSYGRRPRVESANALLRTLLTRVDRGFCTTSDPERNELIFGLTPVAINLSVYEHRLQDDIEVVEVGRAESFGEEIDAFLDKHADSPGADSPVGESVDEGPATTDGEPGVEVTPRSTSPPYD